MHILNQVQVNLIYNTNRNLFLWIEIFISTLDLYNTTADRWSCHLPNRNVCATHVLPMGVGPFAFRYQGNGSTPANILIPLERQLIALQLCRWQFLADRCNATFGYYHEMSSVCLPVVCRVYHACIVAKRFDGSRWNLARRLALAQVTLC